MSTELKVKSKHLGEEAKIIRFEEKKALKQFRYEHAKYREQGMNDLRPSGFASFRSYKSLNEHRRWDVRNENRATFLARAFLAGTPYSSVENKVVDSIKFNAYILPRLVKMAKKYGTANNSKEDVMMWLKT